MSDKVMRWFITVPPVQGVVGQWEDEADEPIVRGVIDLTEAERQTLEVRLDALQEADIIGFYTIDLYDEPAVYNAHGVLLSITGLDDDEAAQETAQIWHNAVVI